MTATETLEHARRLAAELGLPLDGLDRLAVSPRMAARLLSVSLSQIEKRVASGDLRAFRVGRSVRIELMELVAFIERNRKLGRARGTFRGTPLAPTGCPREPHGRERFRND